MDGLVAYSSPPGGTFGQFSRKPTKLDEKEATEDVGQCCHPDVPLQQLRARRVSRQHPPDPHASAKSTKFPRTEETERGKGGD